MIIANTFDTRAPKSYWGIYLAPNGHASGPAPNLTDNQITNFTQGGIYIENSGNQGSLLNNNRATGPNPHFFDKPL